MSHQIHHAPLALATDGSVLANLHHVTGDEDPQRLLALARELGAVVFIGVVVTKTELKLADRQLDDAATAIASEILGRRMHR